MMVECSRLFLVADLKIGKKAKVYRRNQDFYHLRLAAGSALANGVPLNEVQILFHITRGQVLYWNRKVKDPSFQ